MNTNTKKIIGIFGTIVIILVIVLAIYSTIDNDNSSEDKHRTGDKSLFLFFEKDVDAKTLTLIDMPSWANDLNWNDIELIEDVGNAILPNGIIQEGDIISNCTGNISIIYKPNEQPLGEYDFLGLTNDYPELDFIIDYYYTAEATYIDIEIKQSNLTYTYFEDTENKCAEWIKQSPCWNLSDLKTNTTQLTDDEINETINTIHNAGFMSLNDTYGVQDELQRYYTYTLSVTMGEKEKQVIFLSYPDGPTMPDAFITVRDYLVQLVNYKFT